MSAIDQDFVRDLIERYSDASGGNGRDFHNGAYAAIADEMAQAVEATLGESPRLPHFWTHDGVLHIEATRMPTRIVVCEGGTCEFVPKRELDASEAENAKLRELAVLNWEWAHGCCGNNCKMQTDGCGYGIDHECNYEREIADRMRELGVVVE